jgi:hypothetical protein
MTRAELKVVEDPDALRVTWLAGERLRGLAMVGAGAAGGAVIGAAIGAAMGAGLGVLAGTLVGVIGLLHESETRYNRLTLDAQAITLDTVRVRAASKPAQLAPERARRESDRFWLGEDGPTTRIPLADLVGLGHTDYGLWLDQSTPDGIVRHELDLSRFHREDIARLHAVLVERGVGQGRTETDAEARERRRLATLANQRQSTR